MSDSLRSQQWAYQQNPYLVSLTTRVVSAEPGKLFLEDTVFYPTGGGQPGDSGRLVCRDGVERIITNARRCRQTGSIIHELADSEQVLEPGQSVTVELDWERRYAHMRMHTCLHLLSAIIPHGVTGGGLTDKKGRLDFDIQGDLPDKEILTEQLNELISQSLPVSVEMLDESILDEQPDLVKTMSVKPPRGAGTLRMIRVHDADFQPCGGTHVGNTSEIGPVRVTKVISKGKQNKRVQIAFIDPDDSNVKEQGDG